MSNEVVEIHTYDIRKSELNSLKLLPLNKNKITINYNFLIALVAIINIITLFIYFGKNS